ncbi:Lipase, secreted [Moelleriella libera RCEF 2490]|uniref:Lipase, secreted n=1 Tax=Moelleriella libera RCEF 2490 TaxID=1081109 RepID=A0A167ZLF1_9HYPO|nr:Lipase, secreted [Moelleriella libera RCEF 2490]
MKMVLSQLGMVVLACFLPLAHTAPLEPKAVPVLPTDDPFYAIPEGIQNFQPGSLLRWRRPPNQIAAFGVARLNLKDSFQILYRTSDNFGNATATVATILVPYNADYGKLLSYQVAEDAADVNCAPSYVFQFEASDSGKFGTIGTQTELLLIDAALEEGWVVISPDYEGPHATFLANRAAGHAVLDGIRAALGSQGVTGIRHDARVGIQGYSGGSFASIFAAELQPTYAPELKIAGAALGGVVPDILNAMNAMNRHAAAGLIASGINGLANAYPELRKVISDQILPEYSEAFRQASKQCLVANIIDYAFADLFSQVKDSQVIFQEPAKSIMKDNSAGQATPRIPLFIYKPIHDEVSPIADTDKLVEQYCADGASVEYVRDFISEHVSLAVTGAPMSFSWMKRVLNGEQPRKGCSTRSVASTLFDLSTIEVLPEFLFHALLDLFGRRTGPAGTMA